MKKLTLASLIAAMFVLPATAGDHEHLNKDKISSTFSELDNDEDGYISKEEADDDDIWEHFSSIDGILGHPADGNLSKSEFDAYMQRHTGEVASNKEVSDSAKDSKMKDLDPIEHNFETLDDDDNGFISLSEASDHNVKDHFGYADANSDKRISRDEFEHYTMSGTEVTVSNKY
ncbi:EF-hand domain-containing protein [Aliiglaciecola litoralis]|uniref:EF-hand domain-containing protein n=1 Tax=Aliiglaciecola litoralis TaxID=582857 RepID=A0ABP3X2G0_9ALTE